MAIGCVRLRNKHVVEAYVWSRRGRIRFRYTCMAVSRQKQLDFSAKDLGFVTSVHWELGATVLPGHQVPALFLMSLPHQTRRSTVCRYILFLHLKVTWTIRVADSVNSGDSYKHLLPVIDEGMAQELDLVRGIPGAFTEVQALRTAVSGFRPQWNLKTQLHLIVIFHSR